MDKAAALKIPCLLHFDGPGIFLLNVLPFCQLIVEIRRSNTFTF